MKTQFEILNKNKELNNSELKNKLYENEELKTNIQFLNRRNEQMESVNSELRKENLDHIQKLNDLVEKYEKLENVSQKIMNKSIDLKKEFDIQKNSKEHIFKLNKLLNYKNFYLVEDEGNLRTLNKALKMKIQNLYQTNYNNGEIMNSLTDHQKQSYQKQMDKIKEIEDLLNTERNLRQSLLTKNKNLKNQILNLQNDFNFQKIQNSAMTQENERILQLISRFDDNSELIQKIPAREESSFVLETSIDTQLETSVFDLILKIKKMNIRLKSLELSL